MKPEFRFALFLLFVIGVPVVCIVYVNHQTATDPNPQGTISSPKEEIQTSLSSDPALEAALPRLQAKCGPGVSREQLQRMAEKGSEVLAENGVTENAASVASHVADSIPNNYHPGPKSAEVFAAYLTLRTHRQ